MARAADDSLAATERGGPGDAVAPQRLQDAHGAPRVVVAARAGNGS